MKVDSSHYIKYIIKRANKDYDDYVGYAMRMTMIWKRHILRKHMSKSQFWKFIELAKEPIRKGDLYYREKNIVIDDGEIYRDDGPTKLEIPGMFDVINEIIKKYCKHERISEHLDYMPGECIKESQYSYCIDCGKKV